MKLPIILTSCKCCKKQLLLITSIQAYQSEIVCPAPIVVCMGFQLSRNLSAIGRAQENLAQSLLHVEATIHCLNRDIIESAACSEATELPTCARALLLEVQSLLAAQFDEGSDRLREAQISFLMERQENRSSNSVVLCQFLL